MNAPCQLWDFEDLVSCTTVFSSLKWAEPFPGSIWAIYPVKPPALGPAGKHYKYCKFCCCRNYDLLALGTVLLWFLLVWVKTKLGRIGSIVLRLTVHHRGQSGQELKQTVGECCSLVRCPGLAQPAFLYDLETPTYVQHCPQVT